MDAHHRLVAEWARLEREGRALPIPAGAAKARPEPRAGAPVALLFSPHPDDEAIVGALALRLLREVGWRVVDIAVTLGSNPARRDARWAELEACCAQLGFELQCAAPGGLERVNLDARQGDPAQWARATRAIADVLAQRAPAAIFFPHAGDVNTTHVGTHHLVVDALASLGPQFSTHTLETEFWATLHTPNLLVEVTPTDLADLMAALSCHVGEVTRNPYHAGLPAWMIDNVRRGGELVLGQGAPRPDITFATLYRWQRWARGAFNPVASAGRTVSSRDDVSLLFAAAHER